MCDLVWNDNKLITTEVDAEEVISKSRAFNQTFVTVKKQLMWLLDLTVCAESDCIFLKAYQLWSLDQN